MLGEPGAQVRHRPRHVDEGVYAENAVEHGDGVARPLNQERVAHLLVPDGGGVRDAERLAHGPEGVEQFLPRRSKGCVVWCDGWHG